MQDQTSSWPTLCNKNIRAIMQYVEKRLFPRVRFAGIAVVRTERDEISCVAGDLSESGMLVYPRGTTAPPIEPDLKVNFTLPIAQQWIEVEGTVVRETSVGLSRRPAWGIQFIYVPREVQALLRRFVESYHGQEAPAPAEKAVDVPAPVAALRSKPGAAPHPRAPTGPLRAVKSEPPPPRRIPPVPPPEAIDGAGPDARPPSEEPTASARSEEEPTVSSEETTASDRPAAGGTYRLSPEELRYLAKVCETLHPDEEQAPKSPSEDTRSVKDWSRRN